MQRSTTAVIINQAMKTSSLAQARDHWFELLDLAQSGEAVVLVNERAPRRYILTLPPPDGLDASDMATADRRTEQIISATLDLQRRVARLERHLDLAGAPTRES